jgi:hypothetical protein
VILKTNPKKSPLKLGSCTKLEARFCGPFEIMYRISLVYASRTIISIFLFMPCICTKDNAKIRWRRM